MIFLLKRINKNNIYIYQTYLPSLKYFYKTHKYLYILDVKILFL